MFMQHFKGDIMRPFYLSGNSDLIYHGAALNREALTLTLETPIYGKGRANDSAKEIQFIAAHMSAIDLSVFGYAIVYHSSIGAIATYEVRNNKTYKLVSIQQFNILADYAGYTEALIGYSYINNNNHYVYFNSKDKCLYHRPVGYYFANYVTGIPSSMLGVKELSTTPIPPPHAIPLNSIALFDDTLVDMRGVDILESIYKNVSAGPLWEYDLR